jgi:hypothetical protein
MYRSFGMRRAPWQLVLVSYQASVPGEFDQDIRT